MDRDDQGMQREIPQWHVAQFPRYLYLNRNGWQLSTTVSGISFVSMRGAWQRIQLFSLVTSKDYHTLLVEWPVLSLSIVHVRRDVLTKLMPDTVVSTTKLNHFLEN
jgi:hypothetical protein